MIARARKCLAILLVAPTYVRKDALGRHVQWEISSKLLPKILKYMGTAL